jgi:hypothetical protein
LVKKNLSKEKPVILHNLDYLELVSEKNRIVGGVITYTGTNTTFSFAATEAGPDGVALESFAAALGEAYGDSTSASTLTNAFVHDSVFNTAGAMAKASATSSGYDRYDASNAIATSLYSSSLLGTINLDIGISSSLDS